MLGIRSIIVDATTTTIRDLGYSSLDVVVDVVGERTVSYGFVTESPSAVIKYLFRKMTYTWLSGRMTVKPSGLNRSETLVYSQSLAAKPPTKITF